MAYSLSMTLEIRSGNTTEFDIDAIRMAVSGDAPAYGQTNLASSQNFNAQDEELINDITDMIDKVRSNMNSGAGNELAEMISRIAGRLMIPGLSSAAANAIMLEVERRDGENGRGFSAEQWERIKDDVKKEREEQKRVADMADDANNGQLSTTPDRHGLSEQNYADLNTELQTRDGQERFMAFLRMMNPNLSDAEIKKRMEIADAITAERSGRGTDKTKKILETTPPALVDEVTGNLKQYEAAKMGHGNAPPVASKLDAYASLASSDARSYDPLASTNARMGVLAGNDPATNSIGETPAVASKLSVSAQLDDRTNFDGAPSLGASFAAANLAKVPLDVRVTQIASAAPIAPAAPANAGLDV
jgi:hypothetical protein